jgi:hypothetical protein
MKTNVQEFIGLLFASRDYAHKAHLNTKSYAQHMALNAFYDEIIDLADNFAEAWMGRNLQQIGDIPLLKTQQGEPLSVLKRHLDIVEETRDFVPKEDTGLNNIIDEIVALYLSTLYKLKFLG